MAVRLPRASGCLTFKQISSPSLCKAQLNTTVLCSRWSFNGFLWVIHRNANNIHSFTERTRGPLAVHQIRVNEPPLRSPLCCGNLDGYNAYADFLIDWQLRGESRAETH